MERVLVYWIQQEIESFFSLVMRLLLFAGFGGIMVDVFAIVGNESPLQAAEKW